MIEVVSAVIHRDGRFFLQQRSPHRDYPFMWESPGGKVEHGEKPYDALLRELYEETGWKEDMSGIVDPTWFLQYTHTQLFKVTLFKAEAEPDWTPIGLDAVGLGWFTVEEMGKLELTPGNIALYNYLTDERSKHPWK